MRFGHDFEYSYRSAFKLFRSNEVHFESRFQGTSGPPLIRALYYAPDTRVVEDRLKSTEFEVYLPDTIHGEKRTHRCAALINENLWLISDNKIVRLHTPGKLD